MASGRHSFHLFVEYDKGEFCSGASGRFEHVVTRVMFSPNVSADHMEHGEPFHSIVLMLNRLSLKAASSEAFNSSNSVIPSTIVQNGPIGVAHNVRQRIITDDVPSTPAHRAYNACSIRWRILGYSKRAHHVCAL